MPSHKEKTKGDTTAMTEKKEGLTLDTLEAQAPVAPEAKKEEAKKNAPKTSAEVKTTGGDVVELVEKDGHLYFVAKVELKNRGLSQRKRSTVLFALPQKFMPVGDKGTMYMLYVIQPMAKAT